MKTNRIKSKYIYLAIVFIAIFCMSSCSKQNKMNDGMIVNSKLTEKEQELMNGIGAAQYFVYDININNKELNEVECWVDYYENGELKNKVIGVETSIKPGKENNGILMLSVHSNLSNEAEEKWVISYNRKSGSSTSSTSVINPRMKLTATQLGNEKNQIVKDKIIILAAIEKSDNLIDNSIDILNNTNSSIDKISKHNSIYILRCKFTHKK